MDLDKLAKELAAQGQTRTNRKSTISTSTKLARDIQLSAFQYADPYNLFAHTEEPSHRQEETTEQQPSKQQEADDFLRDETGDISSGDWRHVDLEGLELLAEQIRNVLLGEGQLTDDGGGDTSEAPSRIRSRCVDLYRPHRKKLQLFGRSIAAYVCVWVFAFMYVFVCKCVYVRMLTCNT